MMITLYIFSTYLRHHLQNHHLHNYQLLGFLQRLSHHPASFQKFRLLRRARPPRLVWLVAPLFLAQAQALLSELLEELILAFQLLRHPSQCQRQGQGRGQRRGNRQRRCRWHAADRSCPSRFRRACGKLRRKDVSNLTPQIRN